MSRHCLLIFAALCCGLFFCAASDRQRSSTEDVPASDNSAINSDCTGEIFIASLPPVADVICKGQYVGKTNVESLTLPCGKLTVQFIKETKTTNKTITIHPGKNRSVVVQLSQ
jgi:hypothetical protein